MYDCNDAVDALAEAVGPDGPPAWAIFDRDDGDADGFTLRRDTESLLGWRAPAECWALGVAGGGTARSLAGDGARPQTCRVVCTLDRWGCCAGVVHLGDGTVLHDGPEAGRMFDAMRRCFGLHTSPPDGGPALLLSVAWLADLARESRRRRAPLSWDDAVALHPVAGPIASELAAHVPAVPGRRPGDPVASVVAAAAQALTWAGVRERCATGSLLLEGVEPALATWMDDGMFSRWVADAHEPVEATVSAGFAAVVPESREALQRVLVASFSDGFVAGPMRRTTRSRRRGRSRPMSPRP